MQSVSRGQGICEQVRKLCVTLLSVSSGIAGPFIAAPYFYLGLSVEGALVPVLVCRGESIIPWRTAVHMQELWLYLHQLFQPPHSQTPLARLYHHPDQPVGQSLLSGAFPRRGIFFGHSANGAVMMDGGKGKAACGSCHLLRDRAAKQSHHTSRG